MRRVGWACAGGLIAFGVLAILSIGLPFLAAGVLLCAALGRDERSGASWPAPMGAAAVFAGLGLVNLPWQPAFFFVPAAALTAVGLLAGRLSCAGGR